MTLFFSAGGSGPAPYPTDPVNPIDPFHESSPTRRGDGAPTRHRERRSTITKRRPSGDTSYIVLMELSYGARNNIVCSAAVGDASPATRKLTAISSSPCQ